MARSFAVSLLLICLMVRSSEQRATAAPHSAAAPYNADDHPDGFWFGTQNLLCVMGISRKKRAAPRRSTLAPIHRLVYYRGLIFEWGTGANTFYIGMHPSVQSCDITWEEDPAGSSSCSIPKLEEFSANYMSTYGPYNLLTNNCHHYANRLSKLLTSSSCSVEPRKWSQFARGFWKWLGGSSVTTEKPDPPRTGQVTID